MKYTVSETADANGHYTITWESGYIDKSPNPEAYINWVLNRWRLALLDRTQLPDEIQVDLDLDFQQERQFYRFTGDQDDLLSDLHKKYPQAFCCYTD